VLVVEDAVTTGGSTVKAIEKIKEQGLQPVGVVAVVDRLAGGGEAIEAATAGGLAGGAEPDAAPYRALVTIDELYSDRPDRG
jgi:orotate phosphoribosyltransferase